MKAKYIGKWINHEGRTVLKYEYRGKFYEITDYGWVGCEPLSWQHKNAQAHIDEMIDIGERQRKSDFVEEPAEVGLNEFFESIS